VGDVFDLERVLQELREGGQRYHEFLRRDSLSVGIYHLAADDPDPQRPHTEDEVYYVLAGTGRVEIGGETTPITPGSIVFVGKRVPHKFLDYPDGLTLLVIFAPARGTATG
jgi:mannose-6-phosphate isomerase-like protein (cupin superfamily)